MRQLRRGLPALLVALALAGPGRAAAQEPEPENLALASDWPTLQTLLRLPDWMDLQFSVTAEPLFNPIGGERSAGSWIQQSTLELNLGAGLNQPISSWTEFDHWQLRVVVNHDAGDGFYNSAIGALFPLQQVAYPAGFYGTEASIERKAGEGWLSFKAGILPLNPDFVEVPVLGNYVHSSFNNTLNIFVADLPISPFSAFGGVVSAHPSKEITLRYGLFDLSSTDTISRWLGLTDGGLGPSVGTAQFLQVDLEPTSMSAAPLQACRTERGVQRRRGPCSAPVSVQNQLPNGLVSLGGFLTSENGNGVYGSVTLPSGLPLGLADRLWIGGSYSPDSSLDLAPTFVGGGLVIQGPLPSRPLDVALFSASAAAASATSSARAPMKRCSSWATASSSTRASTCSPPCSGSSTRAAPLSPCRGSWPPAYKCSSTFKPA